MLADRVVVARHRVHVRVELEIERQDAEKVLVHVVVGVDADDEPRVAALSPRFSEAGRPSCTSFESTFTPSKPSAMRRVASVDPSSTTITS